MLIKNKDKLCGFKFTKLTPIEIIYDTSFNIVGYFLMTYRENYPYRVYAKLDKNLEFVKEVYPIHLSTSKKESFKIFKKNKPFQTSDLFASQYFSWNLETGSIDEDYISGYNVVQCFYRGNLKTTYLRYYAPFDDVPDEKIKEFLRKEKASYAMIYFKGSSNEITKFFAGFSFATDAYKEKASLIGLDSLVEENQ